MTYHVEQNGVEVATSGEVAASSPERTVDTAGQPIDRYTTNWDYTIPADLSSQSTYRVFAKITCGYKDPQLAPQSLPGDEPNLLEKIWFFFLDIFGVDRTEAAPDRVATTVDPVFNETAPVSWIGQASPTPEGFNTVQLGTFDPFATPTPGVELGCKQMIFTVGPR